MPVVMLGCGAPLDLPLPVTEDQLPPESPTLSMSVKCDRKRRHRGLHECSWELTSADSGEICHRVSIKWGSAKADREEETQT